MMRFAAHSLLLLAVASVATACNIKHCSGDLTTTNSGVAGCTHISGDLTLDSSFKNNVNFNLGCIQEVAGNVLVKARGGKFSID